MARPRKTWNITGEVVPPGTLGPNPHNPYSDSTPEERWEGIVNCCAEMVANACRVKTEAQITNEIEAIVQKYGPNRYGMWFIGTTDDVKSLTEERTSDQCHTWNSEDADAAAHILQSYTAKGMARDIKSSHGRFIYIY